MLIPEVELYVMTCPTCNRPIESTFAAEATLRVCSHAVFPNVEREPLTIEAERKWLSVEQIRDWARY